MKLKYVLVMVLVVSNASVCAFKMPSLSLPQMTVGFSDYKKVGLVGAGIGATTVGLYCVYKGKVINRLMRLVARNPKKSMALVAIIGATLVGYKYGLFGYVAKKAQALLAGSKNNTLPVSQKPVNSQLPFRAVSNQEVSASDQKDALLVLKEESVTLEHLPENPDQKNVDIDPLPVSNQEGNASDSKDALLNNNINTGSVTTEGSDTSKTSVFSSLNKNLVELFGVLGRKLGTFEDQPQDSIEERNDDAVNPYK